MRSILLLEGKYYAGLKRPLLVSRPMVESAIAAAMTTYGNLAYPGNPAHFENVVWHERGTDKLGPPVDPTSDPHYSNEWDEWISADYKGPTITARLPDALAWILTVPGRPQPHEVPPDAPKPPAPPPAAPSPPDPTDPRPGQYPPSWAQPGSVPVPPLPIPGQSPPAAPAGPAGQQDSLWCLLLLYLLSKRGRL